MSKIYYFEIIQNIWSVSRIWLGWITLHYIAVTIYANECRGNTFIKVLWSPITSQTPPCKGLLWLINTSSDAIKHMWLLGGGWIVIKLSNYLKYKND